MFIIIISIFQCTSHRPISVADLGLSINHVKLRYRRVYNICVFFFNFDMGRAASQHSNPTPGAPMYGKYLKKNANYARIIHLSLTKCQKGIGYLGVKVFNL